MVGRSRPSEQRLANAKQFVVLVLDGFDLRCAVAVTFGHKTKLQEVKHVEVVCSGCVPLFGVGQCRRVTPALGSGLDAIVIISVDLVSDFHVCLPGYRIANPPVVLGLLQDFSILSIRLLDFVFMLPPRLFAFSLLFRFIMSISYSGFKLMSTKNMPGRKKVLKEDGGRS